jgi:prepilin-type N-terminal cleavage/methylation domain
MRKNYTISDQSGFTLCEVMVVVAIVSVLATISIASYVVFGNKAKTVEAEIALTEVSRREMLYHDAQGKYSSDLQSIGYTPTPPLKYYTIEVQVGPGPQGIEFRAMAKSMSNPQADSWVLTQYENGNTVLEKALPLQWLEVDRQIALILPAAHQAMLGAERPEVDQRVKGQALLFKRRVVLRQQGDRWVQAVNQVQGPMPASVVDKNQPRYSSHILSDKFYQLSDLR